MSLIEKLKRARESTVEVGGFTFTVRRPTDLEMFELRNSLGPRGLLKFVVGWGGVKESDLFNGGDPHPVAFDQDVCAEWLSDRAELLSTVVAKVRETYYQAKGKLDDSAKN